VSDGPPKKRKASTPERGSEALRVSRVEAKALTNLDETLRAIRSSLDKGKQFVAMGRRRFDDDWMVQDAAITTVTQIAEAAKRLPKSFRDERPEVPWRNVIGMRDIVIHEYAIVDLPLVWEALERGFPQIEGSVFPGQGS
jgi:uncharacterized protein with HEPN domain